MRKKPSIKQPTPKELTDALLDLLDRKFYAGDDRKFAQDRSRLLAWVVLWPASWFNARGVTIHGDAYRDIFTEVILQADSHRSERIKYRPAWLKMVLQSHFAMHGEEYYQKAKSMRTLADQTLLIAGQAAPSPAADPIREMALANKLIAGPKGGRKPRAKADLNQQLKLC